MPELPEVETVRRMLEAQVLGRIVVWTKRSRHGLRNEPVRKLTTIEGRRFEAALRHGKYLLLQFEGGTTLLSHLGMSGRWLFSPSEPEPLPHVHARIGFRDGSELRYQDPRRFGQMRLVPTSKAFEDPSLALLGADPVHTPPSGAALYASARSARTSIKAFLLDQRRIAGIGNIYASEILFRTAIDPRRAAGRITRGEWYAIAAEIPKVLGEAIDRMGTTFSAYRTLWNEPGQFGEQLRVYDRPGKPCVVCGTAVRRIVQSGRSTFFCPRCQRTGRSARRPLPGARRAR